MLKLANKEFLSIGFYINLLSNPKSPVNKNVNTVANLARRKPYESSYPSTGVVSGIIKRLRELQTPPRLFKLVAGEIGRSCLKNRTAEFKILTFVLLIILMK